MLLVMSLWIARIILTTKYHEGHLHCGVASTIALFDIDVNAVQLN